MGRAEGAVRYNGSATGNQTGNGMNFCHFQRFVQRHIRQNRRNTCRQHGFAAARCTNHNGIVSACRCNFQRTFYFKLSFHVRKIILV